MGENQAIESIGCFTEWTSWSRCGWSTSTKTRKRYCQNSRLGCGEEDNSETVNCDSNSNSQSNQLRNSQNNFNTGYNSNSMGNNYNSMSNNNNRYGTSNNQNSYYSGYNTYEAPKTFNSNPLKNNNNNNNWNGFSSNFFGR